MILDRLGESQRLLRVIEVSVFQQFGKTLLARLLSAK
jgi:hypothetical protein